MMSRIAFIAVMTVAYPLSLLPLGLLYRLSDFLYYLIYDGIRYRRIIVTDNLRKSFPEKTKSELQAIEKKFYRNLCDLIVENIKLLSISKSETEKRCVITNIEILHEYYRQGKSVIVTIGHCGNWELAGLATSLTVKQRSITFYRKLRNPHFDRFARELRAKFGMELLPHTSVRQMLRQEGKQPNLYIFITDQAPANAKTSQWLNFLNQDTAVFSGTEKTARLLGHPVFFADIQRIKRGYYSIEVILLTEKPSQTMEGEITELHTRVLEKAIQKNPDNWLWTHRRWKRIRPVEQPNSIINAG